MTLDPLFGFAPLHLLRALGPLPEHGEAPGVVRFPAVGFFADLTDFTALAVRLGEEGPVGTERLSRLLAAAFEALVGSIAGCGGEVVKYAGDALFATWTVEGDPGALVANTVAAGVLARRALSAVAVSQEGELAVRIGVGLGELTATRLGGYAGRWELLVGGPALSPAVEAQGSAGPGELVLAPQAWAVAPDSWTGIAVPAAGMRFEQGRIPTGAPRPRRGELEDWERALFRAHVSPTVLAELALGTEVWLSELRRVSVVFVHLERGEVGAGLQALHEATRVIQAGLDRYDGTLDKLSVDDKGTVAIGVFGLPPGPSERRADRAVQAALVLHEDLASMGWSPSVGLTTSTLLAGPVGPPVRREYTLLGAGMNLAARLMQAASGRVLCDRDTWEEARGTVHFQGPRRLELKGYPDAVEVWDVEGLQPAPPPLDVLVGRDDVTLALESWLSARPSGPVLVHGPAGIGKSSVLRRAARAAADMGMRSLWASGERVHRNTPYQPWRSLLEQLFDLSRDLDSGARREGLREKLAAWPSVAQLAPLLAPFIELTVDATPLTENLEGVTRAERTSEAVTGVVRRLASEQPVLLVLDDAHWVDSATWDLLHELCRGSPPLWVLAGHRPFEGPPTPGLQAILELPSTRQLELGALSPGQIAEVIALRLEVQDVSEPIASWVVEKSGGNPYFVVELVKSLADHGGLRIEGATAQVGPRELEPTPIPGTIEQVISSRVGTLSLMGQHVVKAASAIGEHFEAPLVAQMLHVDEGVVQDRLATLASAGLVVPPSNGSGTWAFCHALTRDVTYGLLLQAQARPLHRAVALWYEAQRDRGPAVHAIIAHHWEAAEDFEPMVLHLGAAAEHADAEGVYAESQQHLTRLLAHVREPEDPAARLDVVRWERMLATAGFRLGDLASCLEHAQRSLELAGQAVPRRTAGQLWALSTSLVRIGLWRLGIGLRRPAPGSVAGGLAAEASLAWGRIAEHGYFIGPLPWLLAAFRSLDLGIRGSEPADLARQMGVVAVVLAPARRPDLAGPWVRRAQREARRSENPRAACFAQWCQAMVAATRGRWALATDLSERVMLTAQALGDRETLQYARVVGSVSAYLTGRFDEARRIFAELGQAAGGAKNRQFQAWGAYGQAECLLPQGRFDEAEPLLREALRLLDEVPEIPSEMVVWGLLGRVHAHRGEWDCACAAADECLERAETFKPIIWAILEGFASPLEVHLERWAATGHRDAGRLRRSERVLRNFAVVFRFARPRLLRLQAERLHLDGKARQARKRLARAARLAESMDMPHEASMARTLQEELGHGGE